MASSNSIKDEEFSERVKKTFGSLFSSMEPSPSSLSNPLWSLTGSQAQKKEWRRDIDTSRDSNPCSSSFDDFLSHARKNSRKNLKNYRNELQDDLKDLDEDDDDDVEDDDDGGQKVDVNDWDVKASIGLDSTLDNEDEEDTYDKVAIGRENAGDQLYMKDVTGTHETHISSPDELLGVVGSRGKDPRANRRAAKIRLKEDDAEAAAKEEEQKSAKSSSTSENGFAKSTERCKNLKPILKRKENESTSKPSKRVRFDPLFVNNDASSNAEVPSETMTPANGSVLNEKVSRVPGYVQNPSNYTRYNLDSTDELNDKSNSGAYQDFVEMVKAKNGGSGSDSDIPADLPKSVTFVPKKKSDTSSKVVHNEVNSEQESDVKRPSMQSTFVDVATEEQETEVGDMEVDEPETSVEPDKEIVFKKQGRQYRNKPVADEPA
ncbi:Protein TSSC4 [Bienertia sinuspersici]